MSINKFDNTRRDAQATEVLPADPEKFNYDLYEEYEAGLNEKCKAFNSAQSGVLVYRRMRVAEVFSYGCRDMKQSLDWQLGALQKSLDYKADIPNFIEPWYGIGTAASSFGLDYTWLEGQAPAVHAKYENVDEALNAEITPIEFTNIGKHTINMINYFLEKTKGRLPMSFCDLQSPLNVATNVVKTDNFLMDFYLNPDGVKQFLDRLADLIIDFHRKYEPLVGNCLVRPGHGSASSRFFKGVMPSDDNALLISPELYQLYAQPSVEKIGNALGGEVFHSCGNWSGYINVVKNIPGIIGVDGAFSVQTDPDPNPCEPFAEGFDNTGITLNARIVGDPDIISNTVKKLWKKGMKLIVVTYCQTPEEQARAYDMIHEICQ